MNDLPRVRPRQSPNKTQLPTASVQPNRKTRPIDTSTRNRMSKAWPRSSEPRRLRIVSDVAQFILPAKEMMDVAIQNIPQAALLRAGVCVGLQVNCQCLYPIY